MGAEGAPSNVHIEHRVVRSATEPANEDSLMSSEVLDSPRRRACPFAPPFLIRQVEDRIREETHRTLQSRT